MSATTLRFTFSVGVSSPLLLGEVARQDLELLHLLDAGELLVHLLDVLLDRLADLRVRGQRLGILRQPVLLGERRRLLGVERDQGDEVGPAVADHHALRDQRVLLHLGLDVRRGDVLAAGGDDDVLLAAGDLEEAVGVDLADVAGVEPAVDERLAGRLVVLVVALEDVRPAHQDLAVVGDLHLAAGERLADRAELELVGPRDRRRGRGLRHPPALEHEHAGGVEEAEDLRVDRGGAGDRLDDPPAEQVADVRQHQAVGDLVLDAKRGPRALALALELADPAADADRPVEDRLLHAARVLRLRGRGGVDLLEDPRHGGEVVGLDLGQVGEDLQRVALPVGERRRRRRS